MHPHWELTSNVYKPDELLEKARILNCLVKTTLLIGAVVIILAIDENV